MVSTSVPAATITWSGASSTDTNWSNAANWTGGLPGSSDDVKFFDPGAATGTNIVNNVVDATATIGTLHYANTNVLTSPTNAHTTLIALGQVLNVTGTGLTNGTLSDHTNAFVYTKVMGPGTLNVNNSNTTIYVSQGRAVNNNGTQRSTLDLSGLDTFTATAGRIGVGVRNGGGAANIQNTTGTLLLARTNIISLFFGAGTGYTNFATANSALDIGEDDGNAGGVNFLYLGQTNAFFVDGISVGKTKTTSTMLFSPVFATPVAYFRGTNGVNSRVTFWSVGDMQSTGSSSSQANATNDFSGGTLDAMVNTMSLGRDRNGGNTGTTVTRGTLTFTAGTLDVNTLLLGNQAFTATGNANPMNGVMNVNGPSATLIVNNVLELGHTTVISTAATRTSGNLNITNGTVRANSILSGATSTNNTIVLSGATLVVTNTVGTPAKGITSVTSGNATVQVFVTGLTNVVCTNLTTFGATNIIQPLTVAVFSSYPAQIPLIKYGGSIAGAGYNFGLGANPLPASVPNGYLSNNAANGSIDLVLPTDPRPVVTTPPSSYSGAPGDNVSFSVIVTGVNPLSYQWQRYGTNLSNGPTGNGSTLADVTTSSLSITSAQSSDNGDYTVVITNIYGATTSAPVAVLTISAGNVAPSITGPANQTVIHGSNATFTASVAGVPTPTIQWQKNGADISGATTASLTITNAQYPADQAIYSIVASNVAGSLANSATLTVQVPPSISVQPTNQVVNSGSSVTLVVGASGVPAPGYQWKLNGVDVAGGTGSALTFGSVAPANAGTYTVLVTNASGSSYNVLSASANLVVTSTTLNITSLSPVNSATGICVDTLLRITFNATPTLGTAGKIRIYNVTNSTTTVDTIDLATSAPNGSQARSIAGNTLNTYPVIISGNTATIFPHLGVLTTNQSYYVTMENVVNGVFKDATGATFAGINDSTTWQFTTKLVNPATSSTSFTVAADGSGDFCTVQGVLDFLPANNTTPRTINILNGTYQEIVRVASKHNLTFRGQDRTSTIITYANNDPLNPGTSGRPMLRAQANDITFDTLTLTNATPKGGAQAEALRIDGLRHLYTNVFLASYQDTMLINNIGDTAYFVNCLIQGDTDFIWGGGTPYYQNCEIRALNAGHNTQMRTDASHYGAVFADSYISKTNGASFTTHTLGRAIAGESDNGNNAYLNCRMDNHILPAGWVPGTANQATLRYWEYQSVMPDGITPIDVSSRAGFSVQISSATNLLLRTLTNVLSGWLPSPALHVDSNPVNQSVYSGDNVSLSITAGGIFAPSYQWRKDGTNVPGAVSATLNLVSVSAADAGSYSCVISNVNGILSSSAGTLSVTTLVHPTLTSPSSLGDGNVQFSFSGGSGQNYRVWATADLSLSPIVNTWTQLNSGTFGAAPVIFSDLQATNYPQRFYAVTVP